MFTDTVVVNQAQSILVEQCARLDFDLIVYCFMPDHLHALVEARSADSDLTELVRRFKQTSAFHYRRRTGQSLWQPGYHERVLRSDEDSLAVARYILENPIRANLAKQIGEYPFGGSGLYSAQHLAELWRA